MTTADVYGAKENPYQAWLEATTGKSVLETWLRSNLGRFLITNIHSRPATVVDIGCGEGSTSLRLITALRYMAVRVAYTGIDPFPRQFEAFCKTPAEGLVEEFDLDEGDVDTFQLDKPADLVFASHCLYYADDLRTALGRIIMSGREVILVHRGLRGTCSVRHQFDHLVSHGKSVTTTDTDVARELECLRGQGVFARSEHHRLTARTDVSSCMEDNSKQGQNLISFFLDQSYASLSGVEIADIRRFIRLEYGPLNYQMPQDIGIFYISHK
ncbi:MAG: class I SAM-dependent methyltransferase [Patescibacteria group bacterium]|jgi:SAM-dependent methyltransferase